MVKRGCGGQQSGQGINYRKENMGDRKKRQRMLVISLDAVGARDLPLLETLPNFNRIRREAACCDNVQSVYPSITYPAHTSIVTGLTPGHHRVVNNLRLQPQRPSREDWMWQRSFVKADTLYDAAARADYVTASLLWPVTARSGILYCIPEIFPNRAWQNQVMVSAMNGPIGYQLEMLKKFGHLMDGLNQPRLDDFVTAAAEYTIRKYNPDLFFVHLTDVDSMRHSHGVDAEEAREAFYRHDERLGRLLKALTETGDMEKTTIVVLGDHCQMNTHTVVYPNYYLKKAGFWKVENNERQKDTRRKDELCKEVPKSYDFYAQNCDGSCYIYPGKEMKKKLARMTREERIEVMKKLRSCLREIPSEMIAKIISRKHARELGADGDCICMLEAAPGYYFQNDSDIPYESRSGREKKCGQEEKCRQEKECQQPDAISHATHGYLPDISGYETFFMMSGYGVKKQGRVEKMYLWDEAPTLAHILGIELENDLDGKKVEQLLE